MLAGYQGLNCEYLQYEDPPLNKEYRALVYDVCKFSFMSILSCVLFKWSWNVTYRKGAYQTEYKSSET